MVETCRSRTARPDPLRSYTLPKRRTAACSGNEVRILHRQAEATHWPGLNEPRSSTSVSPVGSPLTWSFASSSGVLRKVCGLASRAKKPTVDPDDRTLNTQARAIETPIRPAADCARIIFDLRPDRKCHAR